MIGKAPKGGITSVVNGQFYEGGQFTPDRGLFCGKGKNKVTRAEFDAAIAEFASIGRTLVYVEQYQLFRLFDARGVLLASEKTVARIVDSHGVESLRAQYARNAAQGYSSRNLPKLPD